MRAWLRRGLLVTGVFALCWGGAIWYWRAGTRVPGTADLANAMLWLPLALLAAGWLGKKLLVRLTRAAPAPAAAAATAEAPPAAASAPPPVAPLQMVAAALRMPGGATAQALAAALQAKQAHPALDGQLCDADGYPMLCGKVAEVDEELQQQLLASWLRAHPQPGLDAETFPYNPEDLRALSLGSEVLIELMQTIVLHPLLPAWRQQMPATRGTVALPTLQLQLLLPAGWSGAQRQAAGAWLWQLAQDEGWPAEKLAPLAPEPAAAPPVPFALLNQIAALAAQERPCGLHIVLACQSHIGEMSVHEWASSGRLFGTSQGDGQIPGEGAAGLLLASAAEAAPFDTGAPVLLQHAAVGVAGSTAGSAAGTRGDAAAIAELARQALALAGIDAAAITLLSADTDQRASRMFELMNGGGTVLPELDLSSQVWCVGAACGHSGPVAALAALALAQQQASDHAAHVLCISNLDPLQRSALVVGPATEAGSLPS